MKGHWMRLGIVLIGIGLVVGGFPAVYAQDEKKDEPKAEFTLDEIIVTAERRETSAQDTPVAVSAWDNSALDQEAINGIEDLQMRMPSTQFTGNKIYMRGVGRDLNQLGMDPGVGIYEDGFYSTEQGALGDLFDVARIEAIRGPQSTLFGRNTIGGLIQILYTRPTKEYTGQAKMVLGAQGSTWLFAGGGPIVEDKLMFRVRLRAWEWDGDQHNFYYDNHPGGYDGQTADLLLLYHPTSKLEFYARYWYSNAQNDIGAGIRPDQYSEATKDIWYTYPGDTEPTLVRTLNTNGVTWYRQSDKSWNRSGELPHPLWKMTDNNPSADDPWKINFDQPGFFDFDGSGIQLTTTYEATDNVTVKYMT
ncbi:MAG: TonB-dependent receptor plug domain-containing protein, partial [Desulfobacterales bacterium]